MAFDDLATRSPPFHFAVQEAASPHQSQVFGGHPAGNRAGLRKFANRVPTL
jgi:hypothetical protein